MDRSFYLQQAASGLRMPIGTHLVLHQHEESQEILNNGRRLGRVVEQAARQFRTPLALPLMDLTLEKAALLSAHGIAETETQSYHFLEPPFEERKIVLTPRMASFPTLRRFRTVFWTGRSPLISARLPIPKAPSRAQTIGERCSHSRIATISRCSRTNAMPTSISISRRSAHSLHAARRSKGS